MKAVTVSRYGGPEVLEVRDLPEPVPGRGEVLVRVTAAAINPTDVLLRRGAQKRFMSSPPPYVLGMDLAGTVLSDGERWDVGAEVMGAVSAFRPTGGAQAELVVVDEWSLARRPDGCSPVEAATVPMNALTASAALDVLGVGASERLVVLGAGGAVGAVTVELAAARGIEVLAVARGSDRDWLKARGAVEVCTVTEVLEGRSFAAGAVVDATPGDPFTAAALAGANGRIVAMRPYAVELAEDLEVVPIFVPDHIGDHATLARIADLVEVGALEPRVAMVMPPDRVADGHRALERGGLRGRPVIAF